MNNLASSLNTKEFAYVKQLLTEDVYQELRHQMHEQLYTLSDLSVNSRIANYWSEKGILPENKTTSGRRKYTLKQAVYIKLAQQLRALDISLDQIKKLKEKLFEPQQLVQIGELIQDENFLKSVMELLPEQKGALLSEYLEEFMNSSSFAQETIDPFEVILYQVIVLRQHVSLIMTDQGDLFPYLMDKHQFMSEIVENFEEKIQRPYWSVSLSAAVADLIVGWSKKKWFNNVAIVSEDEKKVIDMLRKETIDQITIYKNENEPQRVELTRKNKKLDVEHFANQIYPNGYQHIEVKTRNGKVVHFKNTQSINLADIPDKPDE
jgi:DNA-binding transcriptional MerR regulator